MAVRYRKYFPQCKPIPCNGRPNKRHCPGDRPKRSNSEFKDCGVWCLEFFDDSKIWQSLTFKDVRCRADAVKRLAMFISDRERGKLNLPKEKVVPTLAEYSRTYLELYKNAKETTLVNKKRAMGVLTRYLGTYPLDRISGFIIQKFQIERQEKDGAKPGTANEDLSNLRNMLNNAIEEDLLDKNPCQGVKKLKVMQSRDRILNAEETRRLLDNTQGRDRMAVMLGLFCGFRLNETLKLKWSDIDFTKNLLTVYQSKTNKTVLIPLSSYLLNELTTYRSNCPTDYLFEGEGIRRGRISTYGNCFRKLFKRLGIHNFSYHSLRHTFATLCSDTGSDIVTTKELLGHSDITMTSRYSHKQLDAKRSAIERVTDHILDLRKEPVLPLAVQA